MSEVTTNGWLEYKQRIFFQLEQLTGRMEKIENKLDKLREDVLILKTKAWLFGIIGGVIVTALSQFIIGILNK